MPRNRSTTIQNLFSTLELTKRALYAHLHQSLGGTGLSPSHAHILALIERTQPVQLKELASRMYLTPGAITQMLETLFQNDYLRRTSDENDRRSTFVSLTDKGQQKITAIKKMQQERFTQMVSGLTDDELELFLRTQQKMLAYLDQEKKEKK